jgi:hypothetical protein
MKYSVTLRATCTIDVEANDETDARLKAEGIATETTEGFVAWEADEVAEWTPADL